MVTFMKFSIISVISGVSSDSGESIWQIFSLPISQVSFIPFQISFDIVKPTFYRNWWRFLCKGFGFGYYQHVISQIMFGKRTICKQTTSNIRKLCSWVFSHFLNFLNLSVGAAHFKDSCISPGLIVEICKFKMYKW